MKFLIMQFSLTSRHFISLPSKYSSSSRAKEGIIYLLIYYTVYLVFSTSGHIMSNNEFKDMTKEAFVIFYCKYLLV
jgi:hypothetical protein